MEEAIGKAESALKTENTEVNRVLTDLVDFVLSRANSGIRHDEEVQETVESLIGTTLVKVEGEVKYEHEEMADLLNQVIGEAIVKAATGV